MMKKINEITDKELMESWKKGRIWMMMVKDDSKLKRKGLKRMDEIEDEMKKRKVGPWEK